MVDGYEGVARVVIRPDQRDTPHQDVRSGLQETTGSIRTTFPREPGTSSSSGSSGDGGACCGSACCDGACGRAIFVGMLHFIGLYVVEYCRVGSLVFFSREKLHQYSDLNAVVLHFDISSPTSQPSAPRRLQFIQLTKKQQNTIIP